MVESFGPSSFESLATRRVRRNLANTEITATAGGSVREYGMTQNPKKLHSTAERRAGQFIVVTLNTLDRHKSYCGTETVGPARGSSNFYCLDLLGDKSG
jgi:hypothetical protein